MGREIKRVALDFNWPMSKVWEGYINPFYKGHCSSCDSCGGSGESPAAKALKDKWYGYVDFDPRENNSTPFDGTEEPIVNLAKRNSEYMIANPDNRYYSSEDSHFKNEVKRLVSMYNTQWHHHLSQADVDILVKKGRLWDFVREPINDEQREIVKKKVEEGGNSWLPFDNGYKPTAREVNLWSLSGMGHDSLNSWICIKERCRVLKLNPICEKCKGEGSFWDSPENEKKYLKWKPTQPPKGTGWQVWETVSEGSPITAVFKTGEELINHLVNYGDGWSKGKGYSKEAAESFVQGAGWAPSIIVGNGKVYNGIESAVLK